MESSPTHKRPVCTMPKPAYQKDNQRITSHFPSAASAAAQRNINVIPEPSSKRDMPTTPKLCYIPGEIREIKVTHQIDAKQAGRANGNIGISGKVSIDLKSEEDGSQEQIKSVQGLIFIKNQINCHGTIICNDHFLEQSP